MGMTGPESDRGEGRDGLLEPTRGVETEHLIRYEFHCSGHIYPKAFKRGDMVIAVIDCESSMPLPVSSRPFN